MAKKKAASRARKVQEDGSTATAPRKRGGRKPGAWTHVTPDKIIAFREENAISRQRLAEAVGVSQTSVQNWEHGTVATPKMQKRLAELISRGPHAIPSTRRPLPGMYDAAGDAAAVQATGTIVSSYLANNRDVEPEQLLALIRDIRRTLAVESL